MISRSRNYGLLEKSCPKSFAKFLILRPCPQFFNWVFEALNADGETERKE